MQRLLELGSNVEAWTEMGNTPLHAAAAEVRQSRFQDILPRWLTLFSWLGIA